MKIGDVITYNGEHGVVEEIYGSDAHVRFFRYYYDFNSMIPKYSHKTIEVDLLDFYKGKSVFNYLKYYILQIQHEIKEDPVFGLFLLSIIGFITIVIYRIFTIVSMLLGT